MLKTYTLKESDIWDSIVKSFNNYDVYYLSGYLKGFFIHGDGEPLLFYYEDDNIRAINAVMKRDIALDNHFTNVLEKDCYYDLSTPYGYGGWIIQGVGSLNGLFTEYKAWCKDNSIISEFVRFHPVLNNQELVRQFYDVTNLGKTISIPLTNEEDIWNNFDGKNRNVIRKSIKNNVVIKKDLSKGLIDEFKNVYQQTMNRDEADKYYYFEDNFYNTYIDDLKENTDIYYAEYEDKVIASAIILKSNGRLNYHLSGSLREFGSLAATNYLLYEVACWGVKNGYKSFHLGGGVGSSEDNLYKFKKSFYKGDGIQFSIGKMIFDQESYDKLVTLRNNSFEKDNYFPLYRA